MPVVGCDRAVMVTNCMPMATGFARRAEPRRFADRQGEAYLALCKAAAKFRPGRATFPTLAFHACRNAMRSENRSERRRPRTFSDMPGVTDSLADRGPSPFEALDNPAEELARLIDRAKLSPRERRFLRAVHLDGQPVKAFAASEGVSPQWVAFVLSKALKKLQAAAGRD